MTTFSADRPGYALERSGRHTVVMGRPTRRFLLTAAAIAAVALAGPAAAPAASGDFSSSFEPGDPQPAWIDTVEGTRASGVTGPTRSDGIPGNQTGNVVAVRASGENAGGGEVKENLIDGSSQTKWMVF